MPPDGLKANFLPDEASGLCCDVLKQIPAVI